MSAKSDISKNEYMLTDKLAKKGFDRWWHSFTGISTRTGEEKTFFIEYFLCNPLLARERPVLGQAPENIATGKKPSYLMIKAGCWGKNARQIHRFFAWKDVSLREQAPYSIKAGNCLASETYLDGSVRLSEAGLARRREYMCGTGSLSWHLRIEKVLSFNADSMTGKFFRTVNAFAVYRHVEGMKTLYEGTVVLDDEEFAVTPESSFGYAEKSWGSGFPSPWLWLSSCDLLSTKTSKRLAGSAFDISGACPAPFGLPLKPRLTGFFCYEGKPFEFHCMKFWTLPRSKFFCRETEDELIWHIRMESLTALMKIEVHCEKKDMLLLNYEAPDGTRPHERLFSGGTGAAYIRLYKKTGTRITPVDEIVARHINCGYGAGNAPAVEEMSEEDLSL